MVRLIGAPNFSRYLTERYGDRIKARGRSVERKGFRKAEIEVNYDVFFDERRIGVYSLLFTEEGYLSVRSYEGKIPYYVNKKVKTLRKRSRNPSRQPVNAVKLQYFRNRMDGHEKIPFP